VNIFGWIMLGVSLTNALVFVGYCIQRREMRKAEVEFMAELQRRIEHR
jgi:hypothetical protein